MTRNRTGRYCEKSKRFPSHSGRRDLKVGHGYGDISAASLSRAGCDTQAAKAWKLQRGTSNIEAENGAEKIELEALDPAYGETKIPCDGDKHATLGRRNSKPSAVIR